MTAFELAQRFVGEVTERQAPGADHPFIQWALSLCGLGEGTADETPWCSAFVNAICWMLRLPRSKSAAARSWLTVGQPIDLMTATPGHTIVVLKRGGDNSGPDVLNAPGHVGFFAGVEKSATSPRIDTVLLLGGNQGNGVSVARFPADRVLAVRKLA